MFEEVGMGAIEMVKESARKIKGGMVQKTAKYLSQGNINTYAKLAECTKRYVNKHRKVTEIPKMQLPGTTTYSLVTKEENTSSRGKLSEIVEVFFKRNTGIRSGAKGNAKARTLTMKMWELGCLWYAEFPAYCREAGRTWRGWYDEIKQKKKKSRFEWTVTRAMNMVGMTAKDEHEEGLERMAVAAKRHRNKLERDRFRNLGLSISKGSGIALPTSLHEESKEKAAQTMLQRTTCEMQVRTLELTK